MVASVPGNTLSVIMMLVMVTLPQLVTEPVTDQRPPAAHSAGRAVLGHGEDRL
jgi:hypothetical protein